MSSFKNIPLSTQLLFILFILLLGSSSVLSEWSQDPYDPMVVCDMRHPLQFPRIVISSDGGCIIAWHDYHRMQIGVQKVNRDGEIQWQEDGVLVKYDYENGAPGQASGYPFTMSNLVSDGEGGVIIIWMDWTYTDLIAEPGAAYNNIILARHVTSDGEVEWGDRRGLEICSFIPEVWNERNVTNVIPDGESGCMFTWRDDLNPVDSLENGYYAQRLSIDGELLWGENGIRLGSGNAWPYIVSDQAGGFFVYLGADGYQHVNSEGETWEEPLGRAVGDWFIWSRPTEVREGVVYFLLGRRIGRGVIAHLNQLNVERQWLWNMPGVQITPFDEDTLDYNIKRISDHREGCYFVLCFPSQGNPLRVQKFFHFDSDGDQVGPANGVDIPYNLEGRGVAVNSDKQGLYLRYKIEENDSLRFIVQKIDYYGRMLWGEEGVVAWGYASEERISRYYYDIAVDSYGNLFYTKGYEHPDSRYDKLYAWVVSNNGELGIVSEEILGPPSAFHLLLPSDCDTIDTSHPTAFRWERSYDPSPDDEVRYRIWVQLENDSLSYITNDTICVIQLDTLFEEIEPRCSMAWWVEGISEPDTVTSLERFEVIVISNSADDLRQIPPMEFSIQSIHPNPFNSNLNISVNIPNPELLILTIYSVDGRVLETIHFPGLSKGSHTLSFPMNYLSSGKYYISAQLGREKLIREAVLIR
ncbi:MAG: hypothetical protein P9X24_07025 [Candidatus Hatepunaea meridiana]|nr:hypothetical protein [Candidatus Hatepunaea meridiana]